MLGIGSIVEVDISDVAFNGETVAFVGDAKIFIAGAIHGERVRAEITHKRARGYLAIVREVIAPALTRIDHPWPLGSVEQTGAANYGHMTLASQRDMKSRMLGGQLRHAGGEELLSQFSARMLEVHGIEDADAANPGWYYRTRIGVNKLSSGVGMYVSRTGDQVRVHDLPLASARIAELNLFGTAWDDAVPSGEHLRLVAPSASEPVVIVGGQVLRAPGKPGEHTIRETFTYRGREYEYELSSGGFWQIHEHAPNALVAAVFDSLDIVEGTNVVDLYSGAGLFSLVAADLVGAKGRVRAYEGNEAAIAAARANFAGSAWATADAVTINEHTIETLVEDADVVIADPPRAGLGNEAAQILASSAASQIALVSCDSASMARDVSALVRAGREITHFHAVDIFPNTHFVETVCVVE